jgi:sarcosine oxidase subunit gamma
VDVNAADSPVSITHLPPATRLSIRGGERAVGIIGVAAGLAFPQEPCRAATAGPMAALWLGPDEWLLIAEAEVGILLVPAIADALGAEPASVVDISERQVAIEVRGPEAADILNAFNALDLDPAAFPVGMCTRTLFGKAEIVLWRTAAHAFRVEVWRSFAPYVLGCLDEARREYGGAGLSPAPTS